MIYARGIQSCGQLLAIESRSENSPEDLFYCAPNGGRLATIQSGWDCRSGQQFQLKLIVRNLKPRKQHANSVSLIIHCVAKSWRWDGGGDSRFVAWSFWVWELRLAPRRESRIGRQEPFHRSLCFQIARHRVHFLPSRPRCNWDHSSRGRHLFFDKAAARHIPSQVRCSDRVSCLFSRG